MTEQEQTIIANLKHWNSSPMRGVLEKSIIDTVIYMLEEKGLAATLAYVTEQNKAAIGMNAMLGWSAAQYILEGRYTQ